jgi:diguanylate cyclase (GGDEF)-like protein/PAS domain S-box-containing protein
MTSTLLLSPLLDEVGNAIAAFVCCIPSAQQPITTKPLFQGLMELLQAFDQIASVAVFDARGAIKYINDQLVDGTGYCPEMLNGQPRSVILDQTSMTVSEIRTQLRERKACFGRLSLISHMGERKHLQATLIPIYDANAVRCQHLFIGNDITETTVLEEELDFLVHHHEMTHLLNKRGFLREGETLFQSAASHEPIALILFDIDRFKVINDSFGTHLGDQLLQAMATRLLQHATGVLAFHPTSDLFGVLLPAPSSNLLFQYARKLQQALQRPNSINGHSLIVSCTFGITVYPSEAKKLEDLYRRSETALYAGKSIGTGTIQYLTHEMDTQFTRKIQLERSLFTALEDH